MTLGAVCVFCGSSTPRDGRYAEAARALGRTVAARQLRLVYGGGSVGLMGEVADAALDAGGEVVGVIPKGLFSREIAHRGLTALHEVSTMHERKQRMYDLADGFVGLPGGLGTLEEVAEVATWSQLGLHAKPIALLDVDGFWDPLASLLDRMVLVGLLKDAHRGLLHLVTSPEDALAALAAGAPAHVEKWITPEER